MRLLALYLRTRGVPAASGAALATGVAGAVLAPAVAGSPVAGVLGLLVTVLAVAAVAATLGAFDPGLERSAAVRWPPRRVAHLAAGAVLVLGVLVLAAAGGMPLDGGAGVAVRDVTGLVGLAALTAVAAGSHLAWTVPTCWTLLAVAVVTGAGKPAAVVGWMLQPAGSVPAALTAATLAAVGGGAYAWCGARR